MSTTNKRTWPEGLGNTVLLRIEPDSLPFQGIIEWFFPDAIFKPLGKNWLILYSDFTFDVVSNSEHIDLRQTRAAYMLKLINEHEKAIASAGPKKEPIWPATLPKSICLVIENDVAFNSVIAWFAGCIGSDFLSMQKRLKGADTVTLCSDFSFSAQPYKTETDVANALDVISAIKGEKDLNAPVEASTLAEKIVAKHNVILANIAVPPTPTASFGSVAALGHANYFKGVDSCGFNDAPTQRFGHAAVEARINQLKNDIDCAVIPAAIKKNLLDAVGSLVTAFNEYSEAEYRRGEFAGSVASVMTGPLFSQRQRALRSQVPVHVSHDPDSPYYIGDMD